jgi:hypothetical protein
VLLLWTGRAEAFPWMIRHGYFGCSTCHADPSGSGLLTQYGRAQGDLLLRMDYGRAEQPQENPAESSTTSPLWGLVPLPNWLLLSGSYRHLTFYKTEGDRFRTFPMQLDLYGQTRFDWFRAGGSIGLARVPAASRFARRAQITSGQEDGINLISRTHWVGADFGAQRFTARAGRIEMPFGVRIPEHTMWVRDATRTDRESAQQHGISLAYNGELVRGEAMAILGNYQLHPDRLRERGYSGYAEVRMTDWAFAGLSSLVTHAQTDFQSLENGATRQAHGVFARVAPVRKLVVLAEADALIRSRHDLGYVGFVQLDFELVQGLHLGSTGEILDAGYRGTGDPFNTIRREPGFGRPRYGGWLTVDWFFLPQLEARFDAVVRQNSPLTLLAQLHLYL